MNDPRRPDRLNPPSPWSGPVVDYPAYADEAPYAPTYGGQAPPWGPPPQLGPPPQWVPDPNATNPTKRLQAPYWPQDQPPPGGIPPEGLTPPPPHRSGAPRWLWVVAAAAVLLVVALVVAVVIANGSEKDQTAFEPLPPMPTPSSTLPLPTTRSTPSPTAAPVPPPSSEPSWPTETTTPGAAMQTVVYTVNGDGRAISISYIDTGNIIQTEFNVVLPWSKEVSLSKSAIHPANVTIVNIGHNVTCSVTVAGVQVRQRTGVGITICDAGN
ncbi:MmpS family transport accessory protein [Mycobacterium sp.]|uniref:MmpS family transport accessory protein n=1 Tax=Mycobacterium sp. TaxID=1785 RepID=UPI003C795C73